MTTSDEVVRQNIKTVLYGTQEVLPHFKARNAGHVINISVTARPRAVRCHSFGLFGRQTLS